MAKNLGSKLPQDLYFNLTSLEVKGKESKIIIFTTIDDSGYPHHGMLSYLEITSPDPENLVILMYENSTASRNIRRNGKVSLAFAEPSYTYYVKGEGKEVGKALSKAPQETVFTVKVASVLEDRLPTARILTGITYEGYDPIMASREERYKVFEELVSFSASGKV